MATHDPPWAVVCDFDGTIATEDIADTATAHFAPTGWERFAKEWIAGRITMRDCVRRQYELMRAGHGDLRRFVEETAKMRAGFPRFLAAMSRNGIPFQCVSEGIDLLINGFQEKFRVVFPVRTNHAVFADGLLGIWQDPLAPDCVRHGDSCGACKVSAVREFQRRGYRVAILGDGSSDFHVAAVANLVFARRDLVEHCQAQGIRFLPYESFDDVLTRFPGLDGIGHDSAPGLPAES